MQRDIPIPDEIEETVYIDICRDIIVKQKDVTRHLSTVMQAINDSKTPSIEQIEQSSKTKKQVSFFDEIKEPEPSISTKKLDADVWDDACEILNNYVASLDTRPVNK